MKLRWVFQDSAVDPTTEYSLKAALSNECEGAYLILDGQGRVCSQLKVTDLDLC